MANTLTNILPKILARGLLVLRKRCIMPRMVNSDYALEAARKGTTIDIPVPVAVATENVAPGTTGITVGNTTPGLVQVPLNHWKQNTPIHLTDKEMAEVDMNEHFLPMQLEEAIKALASDVNQDILAQYKGATRGVYGYVGTAGTTPFGDSVGVSSATQARKVLNQQLCPVNDRRGVLDYDAEANALDLSAFSDAEKTLSAIVKMEGEIGRKFGIDWAADDDVPYHTAGTAVGGTITVKDQAIVGAQLLNLTGDTEAETIVQGDIITITGQGDTQTYCVITAGVFGASPFTLTGLGIYPGLKVQAEVGDTIAIKASHRVNLVFHRDAFAFATRALEDADSLARSIGGSSQILSMQDPATGLILRLEVSRQHKQTVWEYDILWGAELVRPELACRLAG